MYLFKLQWYILVKKEKGCVKVALTPENSLCVRHAALLKEGLCAGDGTKVVLVCQRTNTAHTNSIHRNLYCCGELQLKLAYYQRVLLQHNLTLVAALVPQYFLISTDAVKNIARADNSRGSQKRQFTATKAD